jgi:hypothetical protein
MLKADGSSKRYRSASVGARRVTTRGPAQCNHRRTRGTPSSTHAHTRASTASARHFCACAVAHGTLTHLLVASRAPARPLAWPLDVSCPGADFIRQRESPRWSRTTRALVPSRLCGRSRSMVAMSARQRTKCVYLCVFLHFLSACLLLAVGANSRSLSPTCAFPASPLYSPQRNRQTYGMVSASLLALEPLASRARPHPPHPCH